MKRLMISMDRGLLDPNSRVSQRFKKYSELFENLDIIVFSKKTKYKVINLTSNMTIYPTNSFNKFFYIFDAIRIGNKLKPEIAYGQDPWFETGIVAYLISRKNKSKLFLQIHTDLFTPAFSKHSISNKIRVLFSKFLLKKADKIRVVSKRIKTSLKDNNIKLKADIDNVVVLPIAVSIPAENIQSVKFPFAQTILTVGRLEKEKNIKLAIDAFALIKKQRPDTGLIIAGDGRLRKELEDYVKSLNLFESVKFLGNSQDVFSLYASVDIYLHTSRYEGYGLTLIESALSSLPIVTTDVGIVGEVLVDGGSCLVARPIAKDVADKLARVLDDSVLAQNLGGRAREVAEDHVMGEEEYLRAYKQAFTV